MTHPTALNILIINPNSDPEMTVRILKTAREFAAGDFQVECLSNREAPRFIDSYEDQIKSAPGMIRLVRENESRFHAFVVACHCDPNLEVLKEITEKPVVGIGEASLKMATMLGHRFSVISTAEHSIPIKQALVRKYHLEGLLASVRAPRQDQEFMSEEEMYYETAQWVVQNDLADVIVLGCAGLSGLDRRLQKRLGIPVLDGVICALIIAAGFARYGVSTSKIRRTHPKN